MPLFMENFDLGFFMENEDTFGGLMRHVAQGGKAITGYYGLPYINRHYGDVQMILRTDHGEEGGSIEVIGMDSHTSGHAIWDVRLNEINIKRKDADKLMRRVSITRPDGSGGMAVVNLVNADVLPSFLEDNLIRMQVVAFPEVIQYFEDEDAYATAQPALRNGNKFLLKEGALFATGFLKNRDPDSPEFESDEHLDDITNVRGTVKALYYGEFEFDGEAHDTFLRCVIDTEFGPLEIIHSVAQVDESQRKNTRVGAVVNFYGTISGDVAIYEYEKGIIRDEAHDLAALRYVFSGSDPERLRSILSESATYLAEYNGASYHGPDEIINRLKFVQEDQTEEYFAHMGTITSIDEGEGMLDYGIGKRCIVLASGEETKYESIAFADINEDGNITRIVTSVNPRYHFTIDEKPKRKTPLDDVKVPESVVEPILMRARFHGLIDESVTDEMVINNSDFAQEFESNVRQMLETMPQGGEADKEKLIANMFGYLFAKAVELEYTQNQPRGFFRKRLVCSYTPTDAWVGTIHSALSTEQHKNLEDAFDLGRQFYKDFKFFQERTGAESYDDNMLTSLMTVQSIGCFYSVKCLKR